MCSLYLIWLLGVTLGCLVEKPQVGRMHTSVQLVSYLAFGRNC